MDPRQEQCFELKRWSGGLETLSGDFQTHLEAAGSLSWASVAASHETGRCGQGREKWTSGFI